MNVNNTLNQIMARRTELLLNFSATVTTSSTELKCGGGETGQGVPLPKAGRTLGLQVWDGTALKTASTEVEFSAGDRVNLYAQYGAGDFTVTLRINGVGSTLSVAGVAPNATLTASLYIVLE